MLDDNTVINQLKGLILDGVNEAQSGHPGGPLSSIDFSYILFTEHLKFSPDDPKWLGRDRFILSAGHESMLLYSLLHAQGFLPLNELKRFRQINSKTPGHPENHLTPGVECATGPLGQGCAMSVGFAIANEHLKAKLDRNLFDHKTWVVLGDGCMQEGITLSAASLAGHLKLSSLIWFYDKNRIQISGATDRSYSDDETKVFEGFGWNVLEIDGHNHKEIREAINRAKNNSSSPTLIVGNTIIANGASSMSGSHKTHGAPFPADEYKHTKEKLGLNPEKSFVFDGENKEHFQRRFNYLRDEVKNWQKNLKRLKEKPEFQKSWSAFFDDVDVESLTKISWDKSQAMATRVSFGKIIEAWAHEIPKLIGGSADLEPSNMTGGFAKKVEDFNSKNPLGRNLAFGVREFPMAAISNGLSLYGGFIAFDATFLVFSDYMRNAIRMGALQKTHVIHEFTHDSFYLGEDGPTHQPIEHLMSLRAIPDLYVMRPADSVETEALMKKSLSEKIVTCHCLSRQKLNYLDRDYDEVFYGAQRGAWVVYGSFEKKCDVIVFASGSEVQLAIKAAKSIESGQNSLKIRVISVPCWEIFFKQDKEYQDLILNKDCVRRVSLEAGSTLGWERFVGMNGLMIGVDHFGASAKARDLEDEFGFTETKVKENIIGYLESFV